MDKILVIVGPTASGKSELAVLLAKKFNGEIISCDSRQIYRGLNLGTGKVPGKWQNKAGKKIFVYKGVMHHCIDCVNPARQYSAALFQKNSAVFFCAPMSKKFSRVFGFGKLKNKFTKKFSRSEISFFVVHASVSGQTTRR